MNLEGIQPNAKKEILENPYTKAGYDTGDLVSYDMGNGKKIVWEVTIVNTPDKDGKIGAQLQRTLDDGTIQKPSVVSVSPEKVTIYKYATKERALAKYEELLKSPTIDSEEKLFNLLDAVARSGVHPTEVGAADGVTDGLWNYQKYLIRIVKSGQGSISRITEEYGLRAKVLEVLGDNIQKIDLNQRIQNIKLEIPPNFKEEKLKRFESLNIGDEIVIGNTSYRKISDESFYMINNKPSSTSHTVVNTITTKQKMIDLLSMPMIPLDEIQIIRHKDKQTPILSEDPKEVEKLRKDFQKIEDLMYPNNSGFFSKKLDIKERIKNGKIEQNRFGDCYLLAAINSVKKTHPDLYYETLVRTIHQGDKLNEWKVTFQGITSGIGSKEEPIVITEKDIIEWSKKGAKADLGDIILERAYAALISVKENGFRGMTLIGKLHGTNKGELNFEGGFGHRALDQILGSGIAEKSETGSYTSDGVSSFAENSNTRLKDSVVSLLEDYSRNPENYIMTVNSPHTINGRRLTDAEYKTMYVENTKNGKTYKEDMYYQHAYSLVGYSNGKVQIENPHNTSKRFSMTIDEFLNFFSHISYVRIRAKYQS